MNFFVITSIIVIIVLSNSELVSSKPRVRTLLSGSSLNIFPDYLHLFYQLFATSPRILDRYATNDIGKITTQREFCDAFGPYLCSCNEKGQIISIALVGHQSSVDLEPLRHFAYLENIHLSDGQFETLQPINWKPLQASGCRKLETLIITRNVVSSLDLSPLHNCKSLNILQISQNEHLENIVFPQLSGGNSLEYLQVAENNMLGFVDLTSLSNCARLCAIYLNNNQLISLILPVSPNWDLLEHFDAQHNKLTALDLEPFAECGKLNKLFLNHNQLNWLTLPSRENGLKWDPSLIFHVQYNKLKMLNVASLSSCFAIHNDVKTDVKLGPELMSRMKMDQEGTVRILTF